MSVAMTADNRTNEPNKYAGFLARQNHQRDSYLGIGVKCLCGKVFDLDADHALHQVDEILRAALVAAAGVAPQAPSEYAYCPIHGDLLAANRSYRCGNAPTGHEYSRHTIPLYGMLDLWMALYGTSHPQFDEFYEKHGYAETWARLLAEVRSRAAAPAEPTGAQVEAAAREWYEQANGYETWASASGKHQQVVKVRAAKALVAAQDAAPQAPNSEPVMSAPQAPKDIHEPNHDRVYCVRCGGNWPCQPAPVQPSSTVDEAALIREAKAEAWDEGYQEANQDLWRDGGREGNPYREGSET